MARQVSPTESSNRPADDAGGERTSKSERTRQRILDAAAEVLASSGYAGTRLSAVAELAELQAPAIYYHFASREDLIEEVITAGITHLVERAEAALAALPSGASPLERIEALIDSHLEVELAESDYARAAVRNNRQVPDAVRARFDALSRSYGDLWRRLFVAAAEEGQLREGLDPDTASRLALGALNWTAEWWQPRRVRAERLAEQARLFIGFAITPD